jgi:hypothetical protein
MWTAWCLTESYSDAGALARFGPECGLPQAYSGHNSMADDPVAADEAHRLARTGDPRRSGAPPFTRSAQSHVQPAPGAVETES